MLHNGIQITLKTNNKQIKGSEKTAWSSIKFKTLSLKVNKYSKMQELISKVTKQRNLSKLKAKNWYQIIKEQKTKHIISKLIYKN